MWYFQYFVPNIIMIFDVYIHINMYIYTLRTHIYTYKYKYSSFLHRRAPRGDSVDVGLSPKPLTPRADQYQVSEWAVKVFTRLVHTRDVFDSYLTRADQYQVRERAVKV